MIRKKEIFFAFLLFALISMVLFWQFFIRGYSLFPGGYLLDWFEPYKSYTMAGQRFTILNKPVAEDVFRHIYPFKVLAVDLLKQFQLPLWNPYNGSGMPLLATVNSGFLDPFNVLFLLMPYLVAWNIYLMLQFLLCGFFTYLYCRQLGLRMQSSLFGAIAFMLSGFVVARVSLGAYGLAISLLPLLLYIFEKYYQDQKTKLVYLIPFAVFSLITSTNPQIALFILLFALTYLFYRRIAIRRLLLFLFLGITLSAIQIFPTVKLVLYSNLRTDTSTYISQYLVPLSHLISIVFPNVFGNPSTYNFWGTKDYVQTVASIGLLPSLFALLYAIEGKNSKYLQIRKLFIVIILFTFFYAVDSPVSRFLTSLPVPILSTDPPSRIFLLSTFCIAILAAGGFEFLFEKKFFFNNKINGCIIFTGILLLLFRWAILFYFYPGSQFNMFIPVALRNIYFELLIAVPGILLYFIAGLLKRNKIKLIISYVIIVLIFTSGFYDAEKYLPFSPSSTVFPNLNLINELKMQAGDTRVFGFGNATIMTDFATYFHFYDPQYYHPLYIKRYGELTAYGNEGRSGFNIGRSDAIVRNEIALTPEQETRRERLLDLLGVKYLIYNKSEFKQPLADPGVVWSDNINFIRENKKALPQAFLVSKIKVIPDNENILKTLFAKNYDPLSQVILEKDPHITLPKPANNGSVSIINYSPNSVSLHSSTVAPSMLVLLDNYYPGWKALVDGKDTEIFRANYTYRAIYLPAGKHAITFEYQPESVYFGMIVSLITLVGIVALFMRKIASEKK